MSGKSQNIIPTEKHSPDSVDRLNFESSQFDVVHSRCMAGGINADGWGDYIKELNRVLVAGGWCQMVETYFNAQSNNGTLTDGKTIRQRFRGLILIPRVSDHALRRW